MVKKTIKEQWLEKIDETKDLATVKALARKAYELESRCYFEDDLVQKLIEKFKEIISSTTTTEIAAFVEINAILQDHEGFAYYSSQDQDNEIYKSLIPKIKTVISETTDVSVLVADNFKEIIENIDDDDLTKTYESKINN